MYHNEQNCKPLIVVATIWSLSSCAVNEKKIKGCTHVKKEHAQEKSNLRIPIKAFIILYDIAFYKQKMFNIFFIKIIMLHQLQNQN